MNGSFLIVDSNEFENLQAIANQPFIDFLGESFEFTNNSIMNSNLQGGV